MASFTCNKELAANKAPEDPFMIKQHQATSLQSSPFLSVHTTPYIDNVSKLSCKTSTNTERNAVTRSISPCFSTNSDSKTFYSAIEVTDIYMPQAVSSTVTELECATPDSDISMQRTWQTMKDSQTPCAVSAQPSNRDGSGSHKRSSRRPKTRPSLSRDSSTSKRDHRSTSYSTGNTSSSSHNRSSKHKHTCIPTDNSQTSTGTPYRSSYSAMSPQKHQDLLSLHQNSCRLFQSPEHAGNSDEHGRTSLKRGHSIHQQSRQGQGESGHRGGSHPTINSHIRSHSTPTRDFAKSTARSRAHSHLLNSYGIYLPPRLEPEIDIEREHCPDKSESVYEPDVEGKQALDVQYSPHGKHDSTCEPIPPTVIDWTSPSTRKREYEKIDRSYRGVRGLWRRFAPQFCQLGDRRTPFFDEGKCGNGVYGGSVRRFRIDISDEQDEEMRMEKLQADSVVVVNQSLKKPDPTVIVKSGLLGNGRERQNWKCFKFKR